MLAQGLRESGPERSISEPLVQPRLIGEPPHLHGILDRAAPAGARAFREGQAAAAPHDRHDAQVDVRGPPAIEADLLLAEMATASEAAVVEEVETSGYFNLNAWSPARNTTEMCVWTTSTRSTGKG